MRRWGRSSGLDLATGYPGKSIHQLTLELEQVPAVRCRLTNYRKLQTVLEQICELNREQLREDRENP